MVIPSWFDDISMGSSLGFSSQTSTRLKWWKMLSKTYNTEIWILVILIEDIHSITNLHFMHIIEEKKQTNFCT